MTATRPPQHDTNSATPRLQPQWDDSPTVAIPVQTLPSPKRRSSLAVWVGIVIAVLLGGAITLGLVLSSQPSPTSPAATAPVQSPDEAFLADVYDTPGLTSSMPSSQLSSIGWSFCDVMSNQQYTREDLIKSLGVSKLGPQVTAVIVDAAHRNLCSQYDFPTVTTASSAPSASASAPSAPAPAGPRASVTDGTYEVGVDMLPGRYKTPGPAASGFGGSCYLERSKDDSGQLDSIIANDNISGPGSISVKAGEFAKFSGGCTWTKQ